MNEGHGIGVGIQESEFGEVTIAFPASTCAALAMRFGFVTFDSADSEKGQ